MRKRTKAREYALQILYAVDITKDDPKECIERFWEGSDESSDQVKTFTNELVLGTADKMKEINSLISKHATNWQLERMAVIDRNVLRFAAYELLFMDDIPPKVSINEAIDIAKKFGGNDSGKFVNGVLDKINKTESKKTK
ncbi:MAG: transcription antitermination factor NusB [Candidatus Omnitrophota bacterium]|nr:transcription antitermination factor NusB [Candidatus Omnitrophota bacterium]